MSEKPSDDAVKSLLNSLKYTSASRFNAARRLEQREQRLSVLITLISIYIVSVTLLPYFTKLPDDVTRLLNFFTVILSISILVASLHYRSNYDSTKAEQHHRSALEINELRREIMAYQEAMSLEKFIDFSRRYDAVLQKYSVNHDDIDYLKATLDRPEDFPSRGSIKRACLQIWLLFHGRWPFIFMIVISAVVFWAIFFYALPAQQLEKPL
jgi:hypothetical protein